MEKWNTHPKKLSDEEVEKKGDGFVEKSTGEKVEARAHKMSKSRGNVINPDHIIEEYGADSLRLYEMFMGPLEQVKPWSTKGVEGVNRFLNRAWRLLINEDSGELNSKINEGDPTKDQLKVLHEAIKKVTEDIESLRFNTAISSLMIFTNEANQWKTIPKSIAQDFVILLSPFAPHVCEELWKLLGNNDSIAYAEWPEFVEEYLKEDSVLYPIQVNGKVRSEIKIPSEKATDKEFVLEQAKEDEKIKEHLKDSELLKEIFVPQRIINLVVKPN